MVPPKPRAAGPLSIAWRDWLAGPDWVGQRFAGVPFDAIVVGSGYGGSVAALRLARKGYRTLLLERGSEYLPGEFPNDFGLVPKFLRVNVPTQGMPIGRASGLVELHLGQGMVAVSGNGLGGGSLINAGVAIEPDADVFAQHEWPAAIRNGTAGDMARDLRRARFALRARRWDSALPGRTDALRKTEALDRLARRLDAPARLLDVTIDGSACTRCGDCASGCNVPGAKQTLRETYLRRAVATGRVQIVAQAEVYRFAPDAQADAAGWRVEAFATDAQHQFTATRELFAEQKPAATHRALVAPLLFICAGTLGSTQLLQRSQARSGGSLTFSPALGTRLSGNGDSLSWVANEPQPVSSVGRGEAGARAWRQAEAGAPYDPEQIVGPTITRAIDLRDTARPLTQRLLIEDGAVPRAIAQLARELLATAHTLRQLDGWWFRRLRHPGAAKEDPLAASAAMAEQSQVLLTMGHDGSPGRLVWLEGPDRTAPFLPQPESLGTYQAQQREFDKLGARHVHLPLWQALPRSAAELMSGHKPSPTVTTVHPLGGAVMGDSPESSVVDHLGRVWAYDPAAPQVARAMLESDSVEPDARGRPHRYRGLHVLDGSIVPTALGCNPLLTITALAERSLRALPRKPDAAAPVGPARDADRRPVAPASPDIGSDATLGETLVARALVLRGRLARALGGRHVSARLEARFPTDSLTALLTRAEHDVPAHATLWLGSGEPGAPAVAQYVSTSGSLKILPADWTSSGPWPLLASATEFAVLLVTPFVAIASVTRHSWASAGGWALATGVLYVVLPLSRSLLTWLVRRGWRDIADTDRTRPLAERLARVPGLVVAMLRQMVHAREKRRMHYRIELRRVEPRECAVVPEKLTLLASKRVAYRASIGELACWAVAALRRRPIALRATFWEQVMDARVRLVPAHPGGSLRTWASGTLRMGFENLIGPGTAEGSREVRGPIALGRRGDTTSGLLAAAGYPLLFLRFALKTRMLDFRLPAYSGLPVADTMARPEPLRGPDGRQWHGELHWVHPVDRGRCSGDTGEESTAPLRLPLRRYRQQDAAGPVLPDVQPGSWNGIPVARSKAVLLLHAFGQSGLTFTFGTTGQNLAESFLAAGYEVWVLEMRMSTRSGYGAEPCTVDQIGQHDIPAAVRHILGHLERELPAQVLRGRMLQMATFAHCIGSAALWMALLSGRLSHGRVPEGGGADSPRLSMLSHAMSSQLHPWVVGAPGPQAKTWLPALLSKIWSRGAVPFAVRGPQDGLALPLLDRLFGSMPAPRQEDIRPPGADHDDASATCRRIRYIDAELFSHDHVGPQTLAIMNQLFGDANLRLFAHARRFIERHRLVDEDGLNRYVTEQNIRRHAAFPIQLLQGADNQLFVVQGAERTFAELGRHHGEWQRQFCRDVQGAPGFLRIAGYGHLDGLIGDQAPRDVFPHVVRFFTDTHARADHRATGSASDGWRLRAPRVGPFVGWVRGAGHEVVVRVSFMPDDGALGAAPHVVLRARSGAQHPFVTWTGTAHWHVREEHNLRMVWGDIHVPAVDAPQEWQVLVFTPGPGPDDEAPPCSPTSDDATLDAVIAAMDAADRQQSTVPPPVRPDHRMHRARFRLPRATLQTLPRGSDLTFAVGTCRHPGLGLDRSRIDDAVRRFLAGPPADEVAFATLLGDQIYADATAGLIDPLSPMERFVERHETAFARGALGDLLAALPVYMTPDDHEWRDNYPLASPLAKRPWPAWTDARTPFGPEERDVFDIACMAVTAFQRLQSPCGWQSAPTYSFEHGCTRVFAIDSRLQRQRNRPAIVTDLHALTAWLSEPAAADALNVVMCGSVVLPGLRPGADPADAGVLDTWQYAPEQRRELLRLLADLVPGRFLLLSGDYHVSGAALVKVDGVVVGAAVVAPPLYAPLRYANCAPESVFEDEQVALGDGREVTLEVPQGGDFAPGSGLGCISVRMADGAVALTYRRTLWTWETGTGEALSCELALQRPGGSHRPPAAEVPETALS